MRSLAQTDPFLKQFFENIPQEMAVTFTEEQLDAVKRAFGPRSWGRHPVDIRLSVPLPGLHFYVVLLGGRERRSRERLSAERGVYPLWTPANITVLTILSSALLISVASTFSVVISSIASTSPYIHPTRIPWIDDQEQCETTGRVWRQGECWDYKHNPLF